jgi:hypothetical protein
MKRFTITLAIVLALVASRSAWTHPHPPLVVKINPDNRTELLRLDLESRETTVLYRTTGHSITDARVSPYYSRVALLETDSTVAASSVNRLVVIDAEGRLLRTVDADVRRFVFSPNGRKLACIAGPFYPGGIGFRPKRAFIVDIDGAGEPRVLAGLEKAHDLNWLTTSAEDSVYFKVLSDGDDRVLRWDETEQRLEESAHDAIRFSPDGKFVLRKPYETIEVGDCEPGAEDDSCLRVVERSSGKELLSLAAQQGTAQGWIYDRGHHLLFLERNPQTETVIEKRGGQELQAELVTGYSAAQGLVFEVGSGKPPVPVVGIIGGEASAGEWVTGDRGVIVTSEEPGAGGSAGSGETVAVCEQLPCETGEEAGPEPDVARLPAPAAERLEPAGDAEFAYANPRFRWAPVAGAAWYRIDVCGDQACDVSVGGAERIVGTEWRSGGLPVGELYWRLAAVEAVADGVPTVGEFTTPMRIFVRSDRVDLEPPGASAKTIAGPGERVVKGDLSLNAPTVKVEPQIDDDLSGVEWWRAEIDGRTVVDSRQVDVAMLEGPWSDGSHQVDVTAEDRAGNSSTVAASRFIVDGQPPKLILQFVTPEVVVSRLRAGKRVSRLSERDFDWFDLTEDSQLGITSVFFDEPREDRRRRARDPQSEDDALAYKSSWPELVLFVRGDWPFGAALGAEATGRRLLWLAAVDDGAGVESLELRMSTTTSPTGGAPAIEIVATDLVGNVSPPLTLGLTR